MSRKFLAVASSAVALTLIICAVDESTAHAAAAGSRNGATKNQARAIEKESRRFERGYGLRPIKVVPPSYPSTRIEQRTVLVPQWVTEFKQVPTTEIRHEEREREIVCYKDVPETVKHTRTVTVLEKQVRSHVEQYTVQKPVTRKVEQKYTVSVPYTESRTATRTVLRPVWKDVERKYTVFVPYDQKRTGLRTVSRCVPVVRTRDVCVDRGHWEEQVSKSVCNVCRPAHQPCRSPCARRGPSGFPIGSIKRSRTRSIRSRPCKCRTSTRSNSSGRKSGRRSRRSARWCRPRSRIRTWCN